MPSIGSTANHSGGLRDGNLFADVRDLHDRIERLARAASIATSGGAAAMPLSARIRRILKLRASRSEIFGHSLFADPAWDILLELYVARLDDRTESVSSICVASGVPSTTAIRWIKLLETEKWISRNQDPSDARRYFLSLTEKGEAAMERFFAQPEFRAGL